MTSSADTRTPPTLRLLPGPAAPPPTATGTARPTLQSAPFRPGELPLTAWVPLDRATRQLIGKGSRETGLPPELWVRIAAEASRITTEISTLIRESRESIIAALDRAAVGPNKATSNVAASELHRYAVELHRGGMACDPEEVLALRLPEEISGAWSAAAARERADMPRWLRATLRSAPACCVSWEAAAAEGCRSLGEWAYAASLRASASASA